MAKSQRESDDATFARRTAKTRVVVKVTGPLGVYQASRLRDELSSCLAQTGCLVLDLAGVTACDVTALQLLCSARRSAASLGKEIVAAAVSDAVLDVISRAGMSSHEVVGAQVREERSR